MVNFAKNFGYELVIEDENRNIRINCKKSGKMIKFKLLYQLEFNSDRKRMSIIVKNENEEIYLYSKGADSEIFPRIQMENNKYNKFIGDS